MFPMHRRSFLAAAGALASERLLFHWLWPRRRRVRARRSAPARAKEDRRADQRLPLPVALVPHRGPLPRRLHEGRRATTSPTSASPAAYVEQVRGNDLSRELAKDHGFRTLGEHRGRAYARHRQARRRWRAAHLRTRRLPVQREGPEALPALRLLPEDRERLREKPARACRSSATST